MSVVLVVNSGSSSFKYQLLELDTERVLATGLVERIGDAAGRITHKVSFTSPESTATDAEYTRELPIADHTAGFREMLAAFAEYGPSLEESAPVAVGHRVVHGGARFFEPTLITPLVEINIDELSVLAPLHNPGALQGIRAAKDAFGDLTPSTRTWRRRTASVATGSTAPPTSS
ncbi:MAG: acetate kinase [Microbacterium sp.]|nr:acetate kinase [Microbacterium sp.]